MNKIYYLLNIVVLTICFTSCHTNVIEEEIILKDGNIYEMSNDCLGKWDSGIINESGWYLLSYTDTISGISVCYLNSNKFKEDDGVLFYFDKSQCVTNIVTNKGFCTVSRNATAKKAMVSLFMYDREIKVYESDFSILSSSITKGDLVTRGVVADGFLNAIKLFFDLNDLNDVREALMSGHNLEAFVKGSISLSSGVIAGSTKANILISLGTLLLENRYREYVNNLPTKYLSSADTFIEDIKKISNSEYKIKVSTYDFNTNQIVDSNLLSIHAGLAVRKNNKDVSYVTNTYILNEHQINSDESFEVTLYVEPGNSYYIVPFLIIKVNGLFHQFNLNTSESLYEYREKPIIRYGSINKLVAFNGMIDSFVQTKAEYFPKNQTMYFEANVKAHMDLGEDVKDWGVYIVENGEPRKFSFLGNEEITIFTEIAKDLVVDRDYSTYVARLHAQIGVYFEDEGWFSKTQLSDPQYETFVYDQKPSMTIANLNVGSTVPISEGDWDRKISYNHDLVVTGAFWMDEVYSFYVGNWTTPGKQGSFIPNDGTNSGSYGVKFSSESTPHSSYKYFGAMVNGNELKSTNNVIYQFNGASCSIYLSGGARSIPMIINMSKINSANELIILNEMVKEDTMHNFE